MRHICTHCKLTSEDGNLWCQQVDCPAGTLPLLFKYGDYLGNIKILDLLVVLQTCTIYKAEREGKPYFFKVANLGKESEKALQDEAKVLKELSQGRVHLTSLPVWADHGAVNGNDAYGIAAFGSQNRYYLLMEWVEVELLGDILLDNPQIWHEYVGWFMLQLARAVHELEHQTGALHLNLCPDVVMVWKNGAGIIQPLLIDFGLLQPIGSKLRPSDAARLRERLSPNYAPPEFYEGGELTPVADVYGLGVLLYEMLAGKPAFARDMPPDSAPTTLKGRDVSADFESQRSARRKALQIKRLDLPQKSRKRKDSSVSLNDIVKLATSRTDPNHFVDISQLKDALRSLYGEPPNRRSLSLNRVLSMVAVVAAAALMGAFVLFVLSVLLQAVFHG